MSLGHTSDFASVLENGRHILEGVHEHVKVTVDESSLELIRPKGFCGLGGGVRGEEVEWGSLVSVTNRGHRLNGESVRVHERHITLFGIVTFLSSLAEFAARGGMETSKIICDVTCLYEGEV